MSEAFGLAAAVGEGRVCTALGWALVRPGQADALGAIGCGRDSLFDLASLTKPFATVTTVAMLIDDGALALHDTVSSWLPEAQGALRRASIADLLHHRAGLAPFAQITDGLSGAAPKRLRALRQRALELPLLHRPGSVVYSDLGFIILAWICQRAGRSVDAARLAPGLPRFIVPSADRVVDPSRFVPSGRDELGRPLLGRVHDPRARHGGGQNCGHAGWFGSIEMVAQVLTAWLDLAVGRASPLPLAARSLIEIAPGGRTAGFDIPTEGGSSGNGWGRRSFGHLGYTGVAFWIDPDNDRAAALLTNRTWPDGADRGIADLRRRFFTAVAKNSAAMVLS